MIDYTKRNRLSATGSRVSYVHPDPSRAERTRRIVADRQVAEDRRAGRPMRLTYPGQTVSLGRVQG